MNLDKLLEIGERCIHQEPPTCTANCPVHLEIIEFVAEIEKGDFQKAAKLMEKKMPFYKIIGQICDHPCESFCVREQVGGAIRISDLERSVLEYGSFKPKKIWPLPKKKEKIAVIGGGLSGLTAATDLDKKGYQISLYEKTNRLGGRLWDYIGASLKEETLSEEIKTVKDKGISIYLDHQLDKKTLIDLQAEYDAVYLGTGDWDEMIEFNPVTFQVGDSNLFVGGRLVTQNDSIIFSASSGRRTALSIERYLSNVSMTDSREREGIFETPLKQDVSETEVQLPVKKQGSVYSKDEAMEEAKRCIKCQCRKCIEGSCHLRKFNMSPDAYIRQINHNERIILGTHYANKMINSCTECGLCKEECFLDISMKDVIQETRESMVERGKMPIRAHDFALKDMAFSNSHRFSMVRKQPETKETNKTKYLFYPGCQLPASYPNDIKAVYQYLMEQMDGDVGLYLGCCGAPADWAGRQDLMKENVEKIKNVWEKMEQPTFILACSSCIRVFKKYLPEISIQSLWDIYAEAGLPNHAERVEAHVLNIHDACGTRENHELHESIRKIVTSLGYTIEELKYSKEKTKCCGYGGLVYYANREQANEFVAERIQESPHDILVYCSMCKDLFVSGGKRTYHLMDLIYPKENEDSAVRKMPTLSERHKNRSMVKQSLLKEIWKENGDDEASVTDSLIIPEDIRQNMEDRYILMEDIQAVIKNAEENKKRFFNSKSGDYLASLRIENVTYWVKYAQKNDKILVSNVYSHRMEIVEE